jgi:hypothetical protein
MKARLTILAALVAAVTLTAVAAAGHDAPKQRVAIDMKMCPKEKFALVPLQGGPLKADSGTISSNWTSTPGRKVMRDGQEFMIYDGAVTTLTGKRGTLTFRDRNEWIYMGQDSNGDGETDGIGFSTWKVVRGTGQYAGITGKGRGGHVGLGCPWYAHYEGLLGAP